MATQKNFRSALNGFNREDVVHYIEYLNSKHTAEINQLNSELEFLRNKANSAIPDPLIAEQAAQIQELTERCENQESELARLESLLRSIPSNRELEEQLKDAQAEKVRLSTQLETVTQQKNALESRMEDELSAYRRAERMERQAKERADQMYHQANGIIADAGVKVEEAAAQISRLAESAMEQLAQLQQAVSGSNQALKDAAASMYAIRPETEE